MYSNGMDQAKSSHGMPGKEGALCGGRSGMKVIFGTLDQLTLENILL